MKSEIELLKDASKEASMSTDKNIKQIEDKYELKCDRLQIQVDSLTEESKIRLNKFKKLKQEYSLILERNKEYEKESLCLKENKEFYKSQYDQLLERINSLLLEKNKFKSQDDKLKSLKDENQKLFMEMKSTKT